MKYLLLLLMLAGCVKIAEPKRTHLQLHANASNYKYLYVTYTNADLKIISFKAIPNNANTQFAYEGDFLPGHVSITANSEDNSNVTVSISDGKFPNPIAIASGGNNKQTVSYDLH